MGEIGRSSNSRWTTYGLALLIGSVSIFGPYLSILGQWVRMEQLFFYSLFIFYLFTLRLKSNINGLGKFTLLSLATILFYSALLTLVGYLSDSIPFTIGGLKSIIAGADALIFPLIVILVTSVLVTKVGSQRSLVLLSAGVLAGLVLSTLVAIFQSSISQAVLAQFWSGDGGVSVGELSQDNLRYTGIFNQPIEAGIAFSLGVILIWALPVGSYLRIALLIVVLTGGGLSGSKVIFAGVTVAALLPLFNGDLIERLKNFTLAVFAILVSASYLYWQGSLAWFVTRFMSPVARAGESPQIDSFLTEPGEIVTGLTGGRFGANGVTSPISSPIGFGLDQTMSPLDSAITEASAKAGYVGVLIISAIYATLMISSLAADRTLKGYPLRSATVLIVVIASTGAGSLYLNRASTIFWMMITTLLFTLLKIRAKANIGKEYEI